MSDLKQSHDALAEVMCDKYTLAKPCCVDGEPDAHTVWLVVDGQSFCLDGYQDTKADADWMRLMLGKALATICKATYEGER